MQKNFERPETPFKNPEEEIAHLRKLIYEKEQNLNSVGLQKDTFSPAREMIAEYKREQPKKVLHEDFEIKKEDVDKIVLKLAPEEHDRQVSELVKLAKEKGIKNALAVVEKMSNFHITDDFHRFVSEYLREGFTIPGLSEKERLFKSLHMSLYEVLIQEEKKEDKTIGLEEIISGMEQFYSSMLSIGAGKSSLNWMSLEIANANFSQEIVFYVAVPNERRGLLEKSLISIFPNAKITEKPDDYNIFNETGYTAGAYALLSKNPIYPIKTYENFNHDPLNVILSSFSKVNRDGEGAAIQLIWSPVGDRYVKKYKEALDKIQKGTPLKEALDIPDSFGGEVLHTFKDLFSSSKSKDEKEKENKPEPIDQVAVEEITKKISSPIVRVNLRVLASSNTKEEAEEILGSLESSFNQFENTVGNSFKWYRSEKSNLRNLVRNFSFRMFDDASATPINLSEMTSIIHFHTKALSASEGLRQSRSATAQAPLDISREGLLLGVNKHRNIETEVRMSEDDRLRHFYCIGQTGTGKSTLLKEMIIQDIQMGNGVCMIDPHGSDVQDVLANIPKERHGDLIYFDPGFTARPMALNMLEYDPKFPEQKTFVVNELFNIFRKLYGNVPESMGPAFEQYFRNSALLVMEDPASGNTLVDMSRVLSDKTYRDLKISKCQNPLVKQFWVNAEKTTGEQGLANYVQYVTNKFDVFLANEIMRPIVAQEKSSFNFREIMDGKKILLVNLAKGRLGDINANLIGLILVGKILMAALSRVDMFGKDFPPFYLYIDEFQNITTDSISTILSEARKYKLSLNIAHQFIAQLEEGIRDSVFGNVGSLCSFRVGAEDAEYLEKQFTPTFVASDLMNIDNRNAYLRLLVGGKPAKPFNIAVLPPPVGNLDQVENLKQLSYASFGRPREEVEKMVLEKYKIT